MTPNSLSARILAALEAAGPQGITKAQFLPMLDCAHSTFRQSLTRLRKYGQPYCTLFRSIPEGGVYFAKQEWRDAAAVAWRAQVKEHKRALNVAAWQRQKAAPKPPKPPKPARVKKQKYAHTLAEWQAVLAGRRAAAEAAKVAARDQKARERAQRKELKQLARDLAKRAAKEEAQAPKLHNIGTHIKAKARDGKLVNKHQATCDRQRRTAVPVPAGPVDYSHAKVTVYETPASRYEVVGPVYRVVDSSECRAWAKAATA